jgi:hypothetical protein
MVDWSCGEFIRPDERYADDEMLLHRVGFRDGEPWLPLAADGVTSET